MAFLPLWILGGPPRIAFIFAYFGLGVLGTLLPLGVLIPLYLLVLLFDVVLVVSLVFNLPLKGIVQSLSELVYMNLTAYLLPLGIIAFTALIVIWAARRWQGEWQRFSLVPVTVLVFSVAGLDGYVQAIGSYGYGRYLSVEQPFNSAVFQSNFAVQMHGNQGAGSEQKTEPNALLRDKLLIIVESWGALLNSTRANAVLAPLLTSQLRSRYDIIQGTTPYFGHTTDAEIRELCGRWMEYQEFATASEVNCLPHQFVTQGYESHSFHGFTSRYFDRAQWYPQLGFDSNYFFEHLAAKGRRSCHDVFSGLCDWEVAEDVSRTLSERTEVPKFVYWLTLDSHLPVSDVPAGERAACNRKEMQDDVEVCRLLESWRLVFELVATMAQENEQLQILLVGDHIPPFWRRSARRQFHSDVVPWISLVPK